jgi:peptide methionine sulfoxide reductase msrA/msrB
VRGRGLLPLVAAVVVTLAGWYAVVTWASRADGSPGGTGTSPRTVATDKDDSMKPRYSRSGYDVTPLAPEQVAKLAARLDPEAYRVTQKGGTEPAFCGRLEDTTKDGVYVCVVCGLPLFSSEHKFHSGTGWPSFYRELDPEHVNRLKDTSYGMVRTEITCARCGSHLGHVFEDGPPPTGLRFCLNSAALKFFERGAALPAESLPVQGEVAYFAGGCFWGVQHYFKRGPGVLDATSGYMQGNLDHPTYEQVCSDATGHAETVRVVFDPRRITYRRLLEAFFAMHDPTQLERQGPDVGSQYRSGIWYVSEEQRGEAEAYIRELEAQKSFGGRKVVTQVEAARTFWPAEEYHQDYIARSGRACHVHDPW